MRTTTFTRLFTLTAGLATVATLALGSSTAAQAGTFAAAGGAGSAVRSADVGSGTPALTAEAKAAGKKAHGAKATTTQILEAYWTADRMAAAISADQDPALASPRRHTSRRPPVISRPARSPPPTTVRSAASRASQARSSPRPAAAAGAGGLVQAAYNPNLPYYVPTAYTAGKVFFTKGGGNYVCSGTIVNSEGKDTVWTAGHCVHGGSGGTWHSNWTFVPAYDDDLANPRPYGTWSAGQLWSKSAWTNSSDFSQDMGVAIMNTNWGWHIVDYFGGQGLTTNRGKSGVWENAFGYPAESPFDGGNLMRCWGSTSPEWDAWLVWSQTVKIPCDMTRGSSGGGWLYGYNGDWGQLNGVNSRIDRIVGPTIMLSPYFDDDAWGLYNSTRYL
jgi:V8-like Glu-specific endopeptidase